MTNLTNLTQLTNSQIAAIFYNISKMLQVKGEDDFRARSYQRAAEAIESSSLEVVALLKNGNLRSISGIGEAIAKKIEELIATGKLEYYEKLKASVPESVLELLEIPGVGTKTAGELFRKLGIDDLKSLEMALESGRLEGLKGIGSKVQLRIKTGLETVKSRKRQRPIGNAMLLADSIIKTLLTLGASRAEITGELRRKKEVVKGLYILAEISESSQLTHLAQLTQLTQADQLKTAILNFPNINPSRAEISQNLCFIEVAGGFPIYILFSKPENFGARLLYHTGSASHLEKINAFAISKGLSPLEEQTPTWAMDKTENELYQTLSLQYVPLELREGTSEVELAALGKLPKLIETENIKGNLHSHTNWSDGANSIEEMLQAAVDFNLEYLAITDHSMSATVANGLSVERLIGQIQTVRQVAKNFPNIEVFIGSEVDILKDGSLDYPDEVLKQLDIVVASVHSNFNLSEAEITQRVIKAMQNKFVRILGHPTGRLLSRREPYQIKVDTIIAEALKRDIALEINAAPDRLDLNSDYAYSAKEAGVKLSINCDAHHVSHFSYFSYGVWVARKAWLEPKDVINCMSFDEVGEWIRKNR